MDRFVRAQHNTSHEFKSSRVQDDGDSIANINAINADGTFQIQTIHTRTFVEDVVQVEDVDDY